MSTYKIGTVTVSNGSTSVTGSGTSWNAVGVRAGDFLFVNGLFGEIASVQSNTALTLVRGWPGSNASGQQYSIALIDDGQRSIAALNSVLQSLGSGTLTSLAGLSAVANEMPYWTGAGVMARTALTAAGRSLLGRAVIETQSQTDTTAGRLMKVGDFGLGAAAASEILDFTDALRPGLYRYREANATGAPGPGEAWFGSALVLRPANSGGRITVIATRANPTNPRTWIGARSGDSGPLNWVEVYTRTNIIGSVSQTDGIPTGAVIQRGSNSNGEFVRLADGTQICWVQDFNMGSVIAAGAGTFADPYRTDSVVNLTWPAAFSAPPAAGYSLRLSESAVTPPARALLLQVNSPISSSGWSDLRAQRSSGSNAAGNILLTVVATGRWF